MRWSICNEFLFYGINLSSILIYSSRMPPDVKWLYVSHNITIKYNMNNKK